MDPKLWSFMRIAAPVVTSLVGTPAAGAAVAGAMGAFDAKSKGASTGGALLQGAGTGALSAATGGIGGAAADVGQSVAGQVAEEAVKEAAVGAATQAGAQAGGEAAGGTFMQTMQKIKPYLEAGTAAYGALGQGQQGGNIAPSPAASMGSFTPMRFSTAARSRQRRPTY
jgi:hypothetical protein